MPLADTDDQWSTRNNGYKMSGGGETLVPVSADLLLPSSQILSLTSAPPSPPAPSSGATMSASGSSPTKPACTEVTHDTLHNCTLSSCLLVFSISNFLLSLVSALGSLPTQKIAPPRI